MAATWAPVEGSPRSVTSVQSGTEDAPTLATDGLSLAGVAGITFWVDAGAGQTISLDSTGQVDIYQYDGGLWGAAPRLTLQIPPGSVGLRRVELGTLTIDNPRGRLAPIANGISVSGATLTIDALVTHHSHLGPIPA